MSDITVRFGGAQILVSYGENTLEAQRQAAAALAQAERAEDEADRSEDEAESAAASAAEASSYVGSAAITTPRVKPTWAAGDAAGQDVIQIDPDGSINNRHIQAIDNEATAMRADAVTNRARRARLLCGVCHLIVYGQSNAIASHGTTQVPGGSTSAGAIITTNVTNAVTFNVGELTNAVTTPASQLASLVPLNNTVGGSREAWGAGCASMIAQILTDEDGVDAAALGHKWLVSSMGVSATAIEQLAQGTVNFDRVKRDLQYGAARAAEQADAMQVYQPRNLLMVEGESDYTIGSTGTGFDAYIQKSARLAKDISAFANASSGRVDQAVQWVIQVCSHISYASRANPIIAKAQLEMEKRGVCMPVIPGYGALTRYGPTNVYGMDTDEIHYVAPGILKLAATLGWQMKRYWYDGVTEKGLRIASVERQGLWTTVQFATTYGPVVIDTTSLPTWQNAGITAADGAGAAVSVTALDTRDLQVGLLHIKTASAPAALRFGWAGATTTGRTGTGGTNIRDSLRDVITFTRPDGVEVPIDNHLPIMELTL